MAEADDVKRSDGGTRGSYSAPALEKGFDVVELLATEPAGLTISEIAGRLGLSISQIFRMIVVMERRGWLYKEPGSDRYRVSYKVLELAYRATPAQELAHVATPIMFALSQSSEQSCQLVVRTGPQAIVVQRQESPRPIGLAVRLGTAVDLAASCSGHVLLAFSDPDRLDETLDGLTYPRSLTRAALRKALDAIRARGFETMPSARIEGVRDISYPIFGFNCRVVAALTVPFLTFIDGSQHVTFEALQQQLAGAARKISEGLGCAFDQFP